MKTSKLVMMALMAAVTAVCSQIAIPLPFSPVPLSLGVLAVLLTGALLEPRYAAGTLLVYLLLGTVGVPVFAGFQAGPARLVGPTGGYLIAYPLMALVVALAVKYLGCRLPVLLGSMVAALALCYLLGTVWLAVSTGKSMAAAAMMAVVPFVPLDLCKVGLASVLALRLRGRINSTAVV